MGLHSLIFTIKVLKKHRLQWIALIRGESTARISGYSLEGREAIAEIVETVRINLVEEGETRESNRILGEDSKMMVDSKVEEGEVEEEDGEEETEAGSGKIMVEEETEEEETEEEETEETEAL